MATLLGGRAYLLACFIYETTEWVLIELTLVLHSTSWSSGFNSGSEWLNTAPVLQS